MTAVVASGGGVLYAGTDGYGVWRSEDAGQTWGTFSEGLGVQAVRALAVDGVCRKVYLVGRGASPGGVWERPLP